MRSFIAHARSDQSENWHTHELQAHLRKVAELAGHFAGNRGAIFARYAGLLHDLGKYQEAFQHYIRKVTGLERENAHLEDVENNRPDKIPHSTAGAKYAVENLDPFFAELSWE